MRLDRLQSCAISVLIIVVISSQFVVAQNSSNASLDVEVRDPSGALVSKAQVQLLVNNKQRSIVQTNQKGEARFNRLQVSLSSSLRGLLFLIKVSLFVSRFSRCVEIVEIVHESFLQGSKIIKCRSFVCF